MSQTVIIVGLGEVGKPLFEIIRTYHEVFGVDIDLTAPIKRCDVMHVCFPFRDQNFADQVVEYIRRYQPALTIINSTVAPGTTRKVQQLVDNPVVYSPVRGKHAKMESDMLHYRKFVAGLNPEATQQTIQHFARAGFQTATFRTPEIAELSKLVETTWLGVLVGWAQEVERMAAQYGASYEEVNAFIKEIAFLPSHVFPGPIGGHCVMANIAILQDRFPCRFLDAILKSNQAKQLELYRRRNKSTFHRSSYGLREED